MSFVTVVVQQSQDSPVADKDLNSGRDFMVRTWKIWRQMKILLSICALALVLSSSGYASVSSATNASPAVVSPAVVSPAVVSPAKTNVSVSDVAIISTTEGDIVMGFWPEVAPNTVENFKALARKGFYDGTCFHRIIRGFMIQGGDPLSKDTSKEAMWGTGSPGYTIKAEFNDRSHEFGVISMARGGDPDSAGSQFFICHGTIGRLNHQYTAFGKMIKGDDVLNKIANTPVVPDRRGEPSKPTQRIEIKSVKIVSADSVK
jgi:peptidyl-prolyl cis-trans isomerase B (cyclophilin B)